MTNKLRSDKAALRDLGSKTPHITEQYKNNIAEVSHQKRVNNKDKCDSLNLLGKPNDFYQTTA
jgi:transposase-like protein